MAIEKDSDSLPVNEQVKDSDSLLVEEQVREDSCILEQNKANRILKYRNQSYMNLVSLAHLVVKNINLYILIFRLRINKLYSTNYVACKLPVIHNLILAILQTGQWDTKSQLDLDE